MPTEISDIELEVLDRGLTNLPTDEVVLLLVSEALAQWKRELFNISEALWDESMDDIVGNIRKKQNIELTGDYITAVHLWARGNK